MKLNRKRAVTGIAAAGLVAGALAAGGVALASTGPAPASATSTSAAPYGPGAGGFGCGRGTHGIHGMWSGQQPVMKAAADYLGLSLTQLHTQLQSGKSLADVAEARGKPVPGLSDAIVKAMTSRINASTALNAQQKAAMISHLKSHLDVMINMDMDMPHPRGPGMGTGMGSHMAGTGWHPADA